MIEFIIGLIIGMVLIYLLSKYICFKNQKEWKGFKRKWQSQQ